MARQWRRSFHPCPLIAHNISSTTRCTPSTIMLFHHSPLSLIAKVVIGVIAMSVSSVDAFSPPPLSSSSSSSSLTSSSSSSVSAPPSSSLTSSRYFQSKERNNYNYSILRYSSSRAKFAEILDKKRMSDQDSVARASYSSEEVVAAAAFDPLFYCSHTAAGWDAYHDSRQRRRQQHHEDDDDAIHGESDCTSITASSHTRTTAPIPTIFSTSPSLLLLVNSQPAFADVNKLISQGDFNPDSFRPICSNSDAFYRLLQSSTRSIVGDDNFVEYGPLIAGGLLRIRLELCVVESFFNEAVGPFIRQNGLNWILPLHESVETFLAGTIFALATTFILVSSTKVIQILAFYWDLLVGGPCRLFGGFFFDRARGEPVTLDVSLFGFFKTRLVGPPVDFEEEERKKKKYNSGDDEGMVPFLDLTKVKPMDVPLLTLSGSVKVVGEVSKVLREFIEALDLFVGRYLVLIASGYIILKVLHFKVFPDFP